jgi:ABC-2 type transport system ATP-binding protein
VITARGLARTFRTRRGAVEAVAGVDIDVDEGELVGFLGPNGAGKTTTLRMLTTLLAPTAGTATVAGHDLRTDPTGVRRRIGYVGQAGGAGPDCRVRDELVLQGRLYGLDAPGATGRADDLLDRLDLAEIGGRVVATLSGGQRRRLDIAMGLVHRPALLFLDDRHGTTLFLTTHYLDEADALCDRVLVIDRGRIVAGGTPDELKRRVSGDLVVVGADRPDRVAELAGRLPGSSEPAVDGRTARFRTPDGAAALPALLRAMDADAVAMTSVEVRRPSLDDVFLELTGRTLRDAEGPAT